MPLLPDRAIPAVDECPVKIKHDQFSHVVTPLVLFLYDHHKMQASIPAGDRVVALDLSGVEWSTVQLAEALSRWLGDGRNVTLLVGGPDGLSQACLARADERWRLSALTFPHPLVRIILAEQLYRAWGILHNHPYHR